MFIYPEYFLFIIGNKTNVLVETIEAGLENVENNGNEGEPKTLVDDFDDDHSSHVSFHDNVDYKIEENSQLYYQNHFFFSIKIT